MMILLIEVAPPKLSLNRCNCPPKAARNFRAPRRNPLPPPIKFAPWLQRHLFSFLHNNNVRPLWNHIVGAIFPRAKVDEILPCIVSQDAIVFHVPAF
jgi:hypothetical protein